MNIFTNTNEFGGYNINILVIILAVAWVLTWKGIALWKAARLSSKKWFIALLIINTFGILEIIYIYFIARKYTVETSDHTETPVVTEVK